MPISAQLTIGEQRQGMRFSVDHPTLAEHRKLGGLSLRIVNISALGFLIHGRQGLERGDRVLLRLPAAGYIEGYCMWTDGDRAGFHFERIIRPDIMSEMLDALGAVHLGRRRSHPKQVQER